MGTISSRPATLRVFAALTVLFALLFTSVMSAQSASAQKTVNRAVRMTATSVDKPIAADYAQWGSKPTNSNVRLLTVSTTLPNSCYKNPTLSVKLVKGVATVQVFALKSITRDVNCLQFRKSVSVSAYVDTANNTVIDAFTKSEIPTVRVLL